jgi:hypothetical protein
VSDMVGSLWMDWDIVRPLTHTIGHRARFPA